MAMSSPQNCQWPINPNDTELWVWQQFGDAMGKALCIMYSESSGNNCAQSVTDDWGLFQLNQYWFKAVATQQSRTDLIATFENYWWDSQTNIALAKWYKDHNGQGWCAWATNSGCGGGC